MIKVAMGLTIYVIISRRETVLCRERNWIAEGTGVRTNVAVNVEFDVEIIRPDDRIHTLSQVLEEEPKT